MPNFINSAILSSWTFSGTSFSGEIINNGTVSPGGLVVSNSSIAGPIDDGGVIIGGISIVGSTITEALNDSGGIVDGITLIDSTITGGIGNAGLIEINGTGFVDGGISLDSRSLLAAETGNGILVGNLSLPTFVSTFAGGITNGGTIRISAPFSQIGVGIDVVHVSRFSGSIVNAGTIMRVGTGPVGGIAVDDVTAFGGDIDNNGTISAFTGVQLDGVSTFAGDINNSGVISTGKTGIPA
jgi:hypothetical protein